MDDKKICINCGMELIQRNGVWLCRKCNSKDIELAHVFIEDFEDDGYVFIECPGATLYDKDTGEIIAGVKFTDDDDPLKGYEIIGKPVYAPTHTKKRRIKKEALGKIRRCQGCQDYTVRMRRPEGPDFFVPSYKYPGRKKLKSVSPVGYEP